MRHTGIATTGGGLINFRAAPWVENTVFAHNSAGKGGAVYNMMDNDNMDGVFAAHTNKPSFVNVAFVANYASERGGAFANDAFSASSCARCKFFGNACGGKGGAVYMDFTSSPSFEGCAFERNYALDAGGAIAADGSSTFLLSRSTVTKNTARFAGGGVYLGTYGAVHGGATNLPRFHWCTIAGNTAVWNGEPDVYYFAKVRDAAWQHMAWT